METRHVIQITDRASYVAILARLQGSWSQLDFKEFAIESPRILKDANVASCFGKELGSTIHEQSPAGSVACMVIPATWTFSHQVVLPTERWTDEAACFDFERYVPVDLEWLTCSVIRQGARAGIVFAVITEPMKTFLVQLEESGIWVDHLVTDMQAALQTLGKANESAIAGFQLIDARRRCLVHSSFDDGNILHWRNGLTNATNSTTSLDQRLEQSNFADSKPIEKWEVFELCEKNSIVGGEHEQIESLPANVIPHHEAVQRIMMAACIADHSGNLRCGALAFSGRWCRLERRLTRCGIALISLLVLLGFLCGIRVYQYEAMSRQLQVEADNVYRATFPDHSSETGAALRLRSERIRLEALTRDVEEHNPEAKSGGVESLQLLHDFTAAIPQGLKLRINEIQLDGRGIRASGQTIAHTTAGELVQALNEKSNLQADPPRTKLRSDSTVDFQVNCRRREHE